MGKILEMPKTVRGITEQISKFLEITIPEIVLSDKHYTSVAELERKNIEELILDRAPFLCVNRAVILRFENSYKILSASVINNGMCEGHFHTHRIVPLVVLSRVVALTGSILVAWLQQNPDIIPLAVRAEQVRSTTPDLIRPPSLVLVEADHLGQKLNYCWINANAWIGNEKVATVKRITYFLADEFLFSFHET